MEDPSAPDEAQHERTIAEGTAHGRLPTIIALVGAVLFGGLALVCRDVRDTNERHLLEQQTLQAGAVLNASIGSIQTSLEAAARAADASNGDPATFRSMMVPLTVGPAPTFSRVFLVRAGAADPSVGVGAVATRVGDADDIAALAVTASGLGDARPLAVGDLLGRGRTIAYAVADARPSARYVVYAERTLSRDPNVRRRTDEPFADLDYAIYLGSVETEDHLLGSSLLDLPITGRRASTTVAFGNTELALVARPIGRLSGSLIAWLAWMVLAAGAAITGSAVWLLRRLELSRAAAARLANENAARFRTEHDIAESLQLSFLPRRISAPPATQIAVRYWPAATAMLIGGDFYDTFRIDDDRWAVVIGDVCGKGIDAAGVTALVRHTLRTALRYEAIPDGALRAVHDALEERDPSTFCTVCLVVCTAGPAGVRDVAVSLGGHAQPLLLRGDEVVSLGVPGTLLGIVEPSLRTVHTEIRPGDAIVLFTDGLTDAPGAAAVSSEEVEALLRRVPHDDAEGIADRIGELSRQRRPMGNTDDTAIMVLRFGMVDALEEALAGGGVVEGRDRPA